MPSLDPFADDAASLGIGDLNVENGRDRVALYGSLDLTRDKAGLKRACELKAVLDAVVRHLETAHDLPDVVPVPEPPTSVKNPFGRSKGPSATRRGGRRTTAPCRRASGGRCCRRPRRGGPRDRARSRGRRSHPAFGAAGHRPPASANPPAYGGVAP